jgi:hypothetical protein
MEDLAITVSYRGKNLELPLLAYNYGHTYRIAVKVNEDEIIFEPDEERQLRAFAPEHMDKELSAAIAAELEKIRG